MTDSEPKLSISTVYRDLLGAACWVLAHFIAMPINALVCIAIAAGSLDRGIAWLVDDRPWTRCILGAADRIEIWGQRR